MSNDLDLFWSRDITLCMFGVACGNLDFAHLYI